MLSADRPPLILLDDRNGLAGLRVRLQRSGWRTQDGWSLPSQTWDVTAMRIVCAGSIEDSAGVEAALLAGVRGAGLIIVTPPEPPETFLEDLERVGPVQRRTARGARFEADTVDLLRALAAGQSVADAATDAVMSLRTAHRRLVDARRALGVKTNRELLTEYGRRYGSLE